LAGKGRVNEPHASFDTQRSTQRHSAAATTNDPRWTAVVARNPAADGKFFYSVKTTGMYCRPSCAARVARPENVAFHLTTADAERAGFRPCKRCKPEQASLTDQRAAEIAELCRFSVVSLRGGSAR
jgi:AraC family transcriptional regulator of adaptative response/methylated-DNA-[protein]-cysteine methyltransferase